jgi:hypothetical protein
MRRMCRERKTGTIIHIHETLITSGVEVEWQSIAPCQITWTGSTFSSYSTGTTLYSFKLVVPVYPWSVRQMRELVGERGVVLAVGEVGEREADDGADEDVLPVI